ncbi:MAG TPA: S-adenosylmethionine:tRNA ribosyltransferase-isomerase [Streptosporangiaceae bacterium]|nr:S-adenosylmethionine:tRNA ribosyltransferase-isomerase [Streptosporangiaceae bacterium]
MLMQFTLPPRPAAARSLPMEFTLPPELAAHEPAEARGLSRDGVRLLVSRRAADQISHHAFRELPELLLPGDLLVVNTSGTVPAAVRIGGGLAVHFSSPTPDGSWLVELREVRGTTTLPYGGGSPRQVLELPGGATLRLGERVTGRLWQARLSTAVLPYLLKHGTPIRYSYVEHDWPLESYQTVFATRPGSAEMPSASRPFTAELVTRLVTRGVAIAPLTLHTGVSSLEGDEAPYPEPYDVPPATARLVNLTRSAGGRVIAIGTTVVRALETAAGPDGIVSQSAGWTSRVITPETGLRVVDGLFTGLHEPRSSHLLMLSAFAGEELLRRCYAAAAERGYLWHEFGDVHLLLP